MIWLRRLAGGLVGLLRRPQLDEDLDEELGQFLDDAVEAKVQAGMSRDAALRAARMELGSMPAVQDGVRDVGWESVAEATWQDLRYATRTLRRSPGLTAVVVVSLALGIGANTAIFSLIHALMLRPLPVSHPEELVEVLSHYPGEPRMSAFRWRYYEHFRDHAESFADMVAVGRATLQVRGDGLEPSTLDGEYVSGNFFTVLGLRPSMGRLLSHQDDQVDSTGAASAVLSWAYWTNRLGADPAIVGKTLVVNAVPITVVGVGPREFSGLQVGVTSSIWMPTAVEPRLETTSRRRDGTLTVGIIGRLKPGATIDGALAEMRVLDQFRLEDMARTRQSAASVKGITIQLASAASGFGALRDRFATALLILMAVVVLLLLIACTNVASLLLARGAARQQEMALRVSLGAGRVRLVRQVLAESALLSVAGGLMGLALAPIGAQALARILLSGREFLRLPQRPEIPVQPDVQILLFTVVATLLTAVVFSIAPAWHAATSAPASMLRAHAAVGESRSRRFFGDGLAVMQVAWSVVLLSAAGLFVQHLSNLRNQDFGFERSSLLLIKLDPTSSGHRSEALFAPYERLLDRFAQVPGVRSASLSAVTPISGAGASRYIAVEGAEEHADARRYIPLNWVGPRYFETFGTPLLAGREFAIADKGGPPVAIVNQSLSRHYFGDASPIGRRFRLVGPSGSGVTGAPPDQAYEIVGVVGDAKYLDLRGAAPRTVYLNSFQEPRMFAHRFALRLTGQASPVVGEVRRIVRDDLATVSVAEVMTMDDLVDASVVPERVMASLSTLFGALGAMLAALGLYGLLAYRVARRTAEIGVRVALGATRHQIARMVLQAALGLVCVGVAIGVPLAVLNRRAVRRVVADVPADDVWPFAVALVAMFAVALLAAYLPAKRAARVEPLDALRQ